MLKSEVNETVDGLGKEERTFLEAYLKVKNLTEDGNFKNQASIRLKEMKEGSALSSSQLKDLDQSLTTKGSLGEILSIGEQSATP